MGKPLYLQRLPKAGRIRIIKFKRTTPGNFSRLIAPQIESNADNVIDASHPWADQLPKFYARKFPTFQNAFMNVRAFPKALLGHPERSYPDQPFSPAPETLYGKDGRISDSGKILNMSLMYIMPKKNVHKQAVVRNRIKTRIRAAIGLLVTRGATVEKMGEEERLVSSGGDGEKWVMQNWTYVFTPNLEVYRMSLTTLLSGLQQTLTEINAKCRTLESVWKLEALKRRQMNSSPPVRGRRSKKVEERAAKRPAETLSRVKALLSPYVPASLKADDYLSDDLFLEDEEEIRPIVPLSTSRSNSSALYNIRLPRPAAESKTNVVAPEVADVDERPSFTQAMFSRKPILKPMVEERKKRSRKR